MDHRTLYLENGRTFTGIFRYEGREWVLRVEDDAGTSYEGGRWPEVGLADDCARMVVAKLAGTADRPQHLEVLAQHRAKGGKVVVGLDRQEKKYSIIVGYPPFRWVDTGLRFDTWEQAREAINL